MAELAAQPTPIQSVYSMFTEDKLIVNRRYQRKLVWTLEENQKLIESLLKKYPIPAVLIAEQAGQTANYEIIDGLQRLHAIVSFIENSFPTPDGKYFNLEYFPTAKSRAESGVFEATKSTDLISQREASTLLDYVLALSVMRGASEQEIDDVFSRINTYGHRLSDQERRQAGMETGFSEMVRRVACMMRGDTSADILPLKAMPQISIDLPSVKRGFAVKAEETFWVAEGILRSTDLRDSMDEQCIADIAVCIITGKLIERSKDALDAVYDRDSPISQEVEAALTTFGTEKFTAEFKYCVDEIIRVCNSGDKVTHLRNLLFKKTNTNAFPSVFATLLIAFHEMIFNEKKIVSDYDCAKVALFDLNDRIDTSRKSTSPEERRKNIDTVKGLISNCFIHGKPQREMYGNHIAIDVDTIIRRSEVEVSGYELKQGLLSLADTRQIDQNLIEKVLKTICAIANNGPEQTGKLLLGVTDKEADAQRIAQMDKITPRKVGKRFAVGVAREAKVLGMSAETYFGQWKTMIKESQLSSPLKESVLSNLDWNDYYGMGILIITVPSQNQLSFFADEVYWREGDSTVHANTAKLTVAIAQRFIR